MPVPSLRELASVFFRLGGLTFGGGSSTIVVLERFLVEDEKWMNRARFRLAYGLSRLTPGTNILAACTALGWMLRGWPGMAVALLMASVPGAIVTVALTGTYDSLVAHPLGAAAFRGAIAAAIGIMCASVYAILKPYLNRGRLRWTLLLALGAAVLSYLGVSPVRVLAIAAMAGALGPKESS
jgi:chromate transporter